MISSRKAPDFDEATVLATLSAMLGARSTYFAERVDGIFRSLSGEHVTNSPMGFRKRMIIANISNMFQSSAREGYIHDLRGVDARFMGRDDPHWAATRQALSCAREQRGEWLTLDGGALRIRVYKVGTAHLEVHPEIAWRLNSVLASLYPTAIASEHRTRPKRPSKDFPAMGRPLPFAVLKVLSEATQQPGHREYSLHYGFRELPKSIRAEVIAVLEGLGAVVTQGASPSARFDYDARTAIAEVIASGCIPDVKAHQYYPTPPEIAAIAVELAQIGPGHSCLEPSAGQGGLADFMPKRTVCVETSRLHCAVLEAKGFAEVYEDDFLTWTPQPAGFGRIVMNPPFSEGRWQAHLEHASGMLAAGGRLVCVLPASARGKDVLPGWRMTWSDVFDNAFVGTSARVVLLLAERG